MDAEALPEAGQEGLPEASPAIRAALDTIGGLWTPDMASWLNEKNPAALRSLNALPDAVDRAALAVDPSALNRACTAWVNSWKFWINSYNRR